MKVNELMLGDWVLIDKAPCKIDAIFYHNVVSYNGNDVSGDTDNFQPIPLTAEILEKNFNKVEDLGQGDIGLHGDGFYIELKACRGKGQAAVWFGNYADNFDGYADYVLPKPTYVHQLQHALRLAGIDKEIELWN